MPYIKSELRSQYDDVLSQINAIQTKGELEYCIFSLMNAYMNDKDANYSNLHDTVYAAIHCGHEFERRFLDKREDNAIEKNGDIL